MAAKKTVFVGTFVHCTSLSQLEVLEHAAIGVGSDGNIVWIERSAGPTFVVADRHPDFGDADVVHASNETFFFPGFIDTHIHASQYQNAGIFGKTTLLDWLRKYTFPTESSFSDLSVAQQVYTRCVKATLSHGTTTATYYTTIHVEATNLMADICHSLGQRAFVGRVCMDSPGNESWYRDTSVEDMISTTEATIEHMSTLDPSGLLISPIITPRSALQCTDAGLQALGALHTRTSLPIQTHVSENRREMDAVAELFPQYNGYVDIYDKTGLLNKHTVLAHAIHMTEAETARVRETGASISHCPVSNTSIASGLAPVRELLDHGIAVGLGTDVSGGYSTSILTAAREAGGVSRLRASLAEGAGATQGESDRLKLSVEECLYLATRGGAKALNLEDRVGGFEVGKAWDAQLVDLGRGNVVLWNREQWDERVAKWLFCGDDRNTTAVWVQGRLVHSTEQH